LVIVVASSTRANLVVLDGAQRAEVNGTYKRNSTNSFYLNALRDSAIVLLIPSGINMEGS